MASRLLLLDCGSISNESATRSQSISTEMQILEQVSKARSRLGHGEGWKSFQLALLTDLFSFF